ncbi:TolC family protein [Sphingobacterium bambusae]|uniref:TolC family protein n=1 Tax=Sphingobacterium bambusae TaxID=662858 RepID=A0ABW6BBI0_9SPHI|nr:efflux transporter outer membrane subunit [Sphingobacterium bambusae]WPL47073.1 efflux transporter outer membrane subunit [Sphingobacterium bambusae]
MLKLKLSNYIAAASLVLLAAACKVPAIVEHKPAEVLPDRYVDQSDSLAATSIPWRQLFTDPYLQTLIDTALTHNQELLITLQEIEIAKNEVRAKDGKILPTVGARVGADVEKVGRYTSQGAGDASTEIDNGQAMPDPLMNYGAQLYAHWEVDIWKKLHNAKSAAISRYLSTVEGKNFVLSNLIGEIANSYYELIALDSQLDVVRQSIQLQKNALAVVKMQKEASRVTELAVQKFQAEVLKSQSLEFDILQQIREAENKISFLIGGYPKQIARDPSNLLAIQTNVIHAGMPSALLANRPDIKQAELELAASKMDVKVARAEFYPSFDLSAAIGLEAFKPSYLLKLPESLLYSVAGDLAGPLINRKAIQAEFATADARQLQAMYNYERTILNAYLETSNHVSKINNLEKGFDLKNQEVDALSRSIAISNDLFKSARADYLEVLMTQRDVLEAKLELIETKKQQLMTVTNVYRDLGGGWK